MERKAIAKETMDILERGWYQGPAGRVEVGETHRASVEGSRFFPPEETPPLPPKAEGMKTRVSLKNQSTVQAVLELAGEEGLGVLNFASAKNPGGGFLNGAMAQEESLAASGGLYPTLLPHTEYYRRNRACGTMMYTGCAIYSPGVVFFRDGEFRLVQRPVTASVLTLPAVNLGQVLQKGEDPSRARVAMKERMRRALRLFGAMGAQSLVLGAYGCGVFRNDPVDVARFWQELLVGEGWGRLFEQVSFSILERPGQDGNIAPFRQIFGGPTNI